MITNMETYKILINGENVDWYKKGKYDYDMHDVEYEIELSLDEKNLDKLELLLDRMVNKSDGVFFNWSIIHKITK